MRTQKELFLEAANWALATEGDNGINIRRMKIDESSYVTLFNGSKSLMYSGYTNPHQAMLKGLIINEEYGKATDILSYCFPKFYNLGEPNEEQRYLAYLADDTYYVDFAVKADGVNIRPYYNEATKRVEFATRGTLLGTVDDEESEHINYGALARVIAQKKYSALFIPSLVDCYSFIFEMIHPSARIITDYADREDLILLAGFDKSTGNEIPFHVLEEYASTYDLNLIQRWYKRVNVGSCNFVHTVEALHKNWADTDTEGTVATFTDYKGVPVYRLKIKNAHYLQMLRTERFCSLKNLVELVRVNQLGTWNEVRKHLYTTLPTMNEELEISYKEHFKTYQDWRRRVSAFRIDLYNEFVKLPSFETQKEFALHIASHPHKSFFFHMKKFKESQENFGTMPVVDTRLLELIEKYIPLE